MTSLQTPTICVCSPGRETQREEIIPEDISTICFDFPVFHDWRIITKFPEAVQDQEPVNGIVRVICFRVFILVLQVQFKPRLLTYLCIYWGNGFSRKVEFAFVFALIFGLFPQSKIMPV